MLSLLKKGPSANKVPAEKIQATYGRYRMQALLSVFLGYLAYYIVRNNFTFIHALSERTVRPQRHADRFAQQLYAHRLRDE